ncbi:MULTISPECIES: DUF2188 domain-containing protein [Dyadobacter]|uniref:DUF2188 domain-containing protein n=1 Tax=Dyadobacter psychrotolerans TaxID=2541721 RepID=A0A4V2Z3L7_9BACT|nr:DUF2188 domain-containing protein [Dyadobacter psychrotolerans]TDE13188.1 DUF2188 domain-containing protein [Dyadobacter psychrotolerans]
MKNYHLTKDGKSWKLQRENTSRATANFAGFNKEEAIRKSAEILGDSNSSLKIHKMDGRIQEERTYPRSADPTKSKG